MHLLIGKDFLNFRQIFITWMILIWQERKVDPENDFKISLKTDKCFLDLNTVFKQIKYIFINL